MRLTELTKDHLSQLERLGNVTEVNMTFNKGSVEFDFFSGVSKLGQTKLQPNKNGWKVVERYDSEMIDLEEDLTWHYHGATDEPVDYQEQYEAEVSAALSGSPYWKAND
jgi:hypothetical protein